MCPASRSRWCFPDKIAAVGKRPMGGQRDHRAGGAGNAGEAVDRLGAVGSDTGPPATAIEARLQTTCDPLLKMTTKVGLASIGPSRGPRRPARRAKRNGRPEVGSRQSLRGTKNLLHFHNR
jgi:hypothetical protein